MNKTKIAQLILDHLDGDIEKLNKDYICVTGKIAPEHSIANAFGSFDEFVNFAKSGIEDGSLKLGGASNEVDEEDSNDDSESESEPESSDEGCEGGGSKTVKIVTNDGSVFKATVPTGMKLKDILKAAKVDVEEGFEVRVNNELQDDMDTVPDDGARISAMRQLKGNE